jgi:Rps23 Pro-64 3,4-dihydroxylase Tpa1-like proline 4-hydroxylase
MNRLARIIAFTFLFTSSVVLGQKPLTVKNSAASQALNQVAKDHIADQAVVNTKLQQARFNLNQSNKALQEQIQALQKSLDEKLKEDKKYKGMLDQLDDLQKKFNDNGQRANVAFQKDLGLLPQKMQSEAAQIQSLSDVVRKENDLATNVTYNEEKQTWAELMAKPEAPKVEKK